MINATESSHGLLRGEKLVILLASPKCVSWQHGYIWERLRSKVVNFAESLAHLALAPTYSIQQQAFARVESSLLLCSYCNVLCLAHATRLLSNGRTYPKRILSVWAEHIDAHIAYALTNKAMSSSLLDSLYWSLLFLPQQLYSLQQQGHVYPAWPPPSLTYSSASWCSTLQNCAVSSTFVSLNEILLSTTLYIDNQVYYIENRG